MVNLHDLKGFIKDKYARHLVVKTDNVEIIVVCSLPGQCSPVHGHGDSDGIIVVLEGELTYTNFYPDGRKVSGVAQPGDVNLTPVGVEHQIANHSDKELTALHIYAPPLAKDLQSFDLGYANEVHIEEVQLPQETIRFLMASVPQPEGSGYDI